MGSEIIHGRVQGTVDVLSGGKRVSRTERNAVIETLAGAVSCDYMDQPTYEARVEAALNARSQYDLEKLTADLPNRPPAPHHIAKKLALWALPLVTSLFVMVPAPVWLYTSTQVTLCSGSGSQQQCWAQHSGLALAGTFGLVILGIAMLIVTIATFITWYDATSSRS